MNEIDYQQFQTEGVTPISNIFANDVSIPYL